MMSRFIILIFLILQTGSCTDDTKNDECGVLPNGNRNIFVRIISVNPNPNGTDNYNETFTVKNFGNESVNLSGWKVIHNGEAQWDLGIIKELKPCFQVTIINLNKETIDNNKDFLKLIDNNNIQVQIVEWANCSEGKEIIPE